MPLPADLTGPPGFYNGEDLRAAHSGPPRRVVVRQTGGKSMKHAIGTTIILLAMATFGATFTLVKVNNFLDIIEFLQNMEVKNDES